jgi:hypothetical protein
MLSQLPRTLRRAAAVLATTLGLVGGAQAGYVVINADPLFVSSPLEGYGWTATGALYVPEGCVGATGDWGATATITASFPGPCGAEGGLVLSDVSVRFYRASDMSTVSTVMLGAYLPMLVGAPGASLQRLDSVTFSTDLEGAIDRVIGLSTSSSQTYTTSLPNLGNAGPAMLDVEFVLDFNMFQLLTEEPPSGRPGGRVASTAGDIEGVGSSLTYTVTNLGTPFTGISDADKVTASNFTADNPLAVPSPGTLGLVLLAGFAAWAERRRRPSHG